MSTSSSCSKPEFPIGTVISGYQVIKKLGSGGFGAVYHVRQGNLDAALKTEFESSEQTLKNEVHTLRIMQWSKCYCKLYAAKSLEWENQKVNIMVMTLCGRSLSKLRKMMPNRQFSKGTAARLSYQLLEAIRDLHSCGILHRDIKASNCGWHEESRRLLLFDLGFCRKYLERDPLTGKLRHRPARESAGFLGTSKYCSIYVHDEMDQGRRDDLWAWLYATAELFLGSLPWSNEDNTHLVSRHKHKVGASLFLKCSREFLPMYDHIKKLKFNSRPNYEMMFSKFKEIYIRLSICESDPYDFEVGSIYYEEYFKNRKSESDSDEKEVDSKVEGSLVTISSSCASSAKEEVEKGEREPKDNETPNNFGNRLAAGLNKAFRKVMGLRKV